MVSIVPLMASSLYRSAALGEGPALEANRSYLCISASLHHRQQWRMWGGGPDAFLVAVDTNSPVYMRGWAWRRAYANVRSIVQ
jgi:hypothetical protein